MIPSSQKNGVALRFFKVAIVYFLITLILGVLLMTGQAYMWFDPAGVKIAHIHAGVLGFITLTIMGAMYQIVPTITGASIYGSIHSRWQFYSVDIGILGFFLTQLLVKGSYKNSLSILFGSLIFISSLLFAYIIFKTLAKGKSKIKPVTIPFFKYAIIYYIAGITMGLLMTVKPEYFSRFLLGKTAHAHLGTLGFITLTIFGAEYQMYPMLTLQKLKSEKWAKVNLWSSIIAIAGFYAGLILLNATILGLFVFLLLISIYIFIGNMLLTLKGAKWGGLDISVKFLTTGHVFLLITSGIGAAMAVFYHFGLIELLKNFGLAGPDFGIFQLIWTHAHLALIGFVTLTIMGAMYHLIPMLVWMEKYGPKMGKEKVPNIQELFSQRIAGLVLLASTVGLLGILIGSLYAISSLLIVSAYIVLGAGLLFSIAMFRIMF